LNHGVDLEKFRYSTSTVVECDKQATVVGLLLTTLGDGGRGQVLSTVDRRLSDVDHTQRPALCTARRAIGRDGAARSFVVR